MRGFVLSVLLCVWGSAFGLTESVPALDEGLYGASVFFSTAGVDPSDNSPVPAYCNGTLISSNVIVTAAHCLKDAFVTNQNMVELQTGKYVYKTRPDGSTYRLGYISDAKEQIRGKFIFTKMLTQKIRSSGLRTKIGPTEDIAVIVLETAVKNTSIQFAQVGDSNSFSEIVSRLDHLRKSVLTVNLFVEMSMDTRRTADLSNLSFASGGVFESKSNSRVEEGDSGAGLFVDHNGKRHLVGVVKGRAETFFSNWDAFTALTPTTACDLAGQIQDLAIQKLICHN